MRIGKYGQTLRKMKGNRIIWSVFDLLITYTSNPKLIHRKSKVINFRLNKLFQVYMMEKYISFSVISLIIDIVFI